MINKLSFKPYYKWNTFNTLCLLKKWNLSLEVLNLIINGIPSIQLTALIFKYASGIVLNLIINGIPSILSPVGVCLARLGFRFKPYYKWNTFNTGEKQIQNGESLPF